ncbi:MAG: diaminopimelate epimerase [Burkholderiales bacterium]|nr:diaminopimelate epimerase [Burkholderiales bacterium]
MRIPFTKMQGAGNDFVVLDETRGSFGLSTAQYRFLADRHFGVGADQILTVRPSPGPGIDFEYVIHNADGGEVEHCGNGARCFVRFVREQGLTTQDTVRVKVKHGVIELRMNPDGRVTVNMGPPVFDHARVPFAPPVQPPLLQNNWQKWPLSLDLEAFVAPVYVGVVSMGNPHAVQLVDDVDTAPVATVGPLVEGHVAFPNRVNAGFMQVVSRNHVRLRVYERGAGETLACGTGACAAVVAGVRWGLLDAPVEVDTHGGRLTISWELTSDLDAPVYMTGPATTVFTGTIELPAV